MRKKKRQYKNLKFVVLVLLVLPIVGYTYATKDPAIIDITPDGKPEATITPIPTPVIITTPDSDIDSKIKIAAFNIQVFGVTKANKPEVMEVLSKIIRNYDIVAVQEIRDATQTALPALVNAVNAMGDEQYDYVVGERLGRTVSKEQYAYLYNTQTIELIGSPYTFPDPNDIFHREPYISYFKARDGNFDFVLITIHTDPNEATEEINSLPIVVNYTKSQFQDEGDFIILGDLNADCRYFNEDGPSPLRSDEYYWVINNSVDTTVKSTDCTYDRIITSIPALVDYTGNSGVFRFDEAYNLTYEDTIAVSDHYPVFAEFWSNQDTD